MPPATIRLSGTATRTPEQPISYFMQQALENPGLISLAAGLVDETSLPTAEVAATLAEMMALPQHARSCLETCVTNRIAFCATGPTTPAPCRAGASRNTSLRFPWRTSRAAISRDY